MSHAVDTMAVNGAVLPISGGDRDTYTPPHYEGAPNAPSYVLAPLLGRDMAAIVRAATAAAGIIPTQEEIRDEVRAAADAVLEPDRARTVGSLLDELIELEAAEEPDEPMRARLATVQAQVGRWVVRLSRKAPDLSDLLAARSEWTAVYGDLYLRRAIQDWDNLRVSCIRRGGFVTAEAMLAVPDRDLPLLEARARALSAGDADLERGSVSP